MSVRAESLAMISPKISFSILRLVERNGERVQARPTDKIEILDLKTNVPQNKGIKVKRVKDPKGFEIRVTRDGMKLGNVRVDFI